MDTRYTLADYNRLLGFIYQGASEERPWLGFVDTLCKSLGARDVMLYMYSKRDRDCSYFVSADRAPHLADIAYINEIMRVSFSMVDTPARIPVTLRDNYLGMPFDQTPLYRKYLRPVDVTYLLYQDIYHDEEVIIRIVAQRTRSQADFDITEKELLNSMTTHLRRALDLRNAHEEGQALASLSFDLLSRMKIGTIVVDACRNVLAINQAAVAVLSKSFGISVKGGRLFFEGTAALKLRQALDVMIMAHCTGMTTQKGVSVGLHSLAGVPELDVVVKPLFLNKLPTTTPGPAALLLFNDCESGAIDIEAEMLQAVYNLTEREAALAALLIQGHTLLEAADVLNVTINTVKTHFKGIYARLGKHRKSQVVAMLSRCTARFLSCPQETRGLVVDLDAERMKASHFDTRPTGYRMTGT